MTNENTTVAVNETTAQNNTAMTQVPVAQPVIVKEDKKKGVIKFVTGLVTGIGLSVLTAFAVDKLGGSSESDD